MKTPQIWSVFFFAENATYCTEKKLVPLDKFCIRIIITIVYVFFRLRNEIEIK